MSDSLDHLLNRVAIVETGLALVFSHCAEDDKSFEDFHMAWSVFSKRSHLLKEAIQRHDGDTIASIGFPSAEHMASFLVAMQTYLVSVCSDGIAMDIVCQEVYELLTNDTLRGSTSELNKLIQLLGEADERSDAMAWKTRRVEEILTRVTEDMELFDRFVECLRRFSEAHDT